MSIVPFIVNKLLSEVEHPSAYDAYDSRLFHPYDRLLFPEHTAYVRPWRHQSHDKSGVSTIVNDKDAFKVNLDVSHFKPEELTVKVVDDYICVEGKHEERSDDHGFISRQFTRRYKLPENVNKEALTSNLSSDHVLQLVAPKKTIDGSKARTIPIIHSNKPAIKAAESKKKEALEKMES